MKTIEQLKQEKQVLESDIERLINEFLYSNPEIQLKIKIDFIELATIYGTPCAFHRVEASITI